MFSLACRWTPRLYAVLLSMRRCGDCGGYSKSPRTGFEQLARECPEFARVYIIYTKRYLELRTGIKFLRKAIYLESYYICSIILPCLKPSRRYLRASTPRMMSCCLWYQLPCEPSPRIPSTYIFPANAYDKASIDTDELITDRVYKENRLRQFIQRQTQRVSMGANNKQAQASKSDKTSNQEQKAKNSPNSANVPSEEERRKESSKLSQQALAARKKAHKLRQAANGAADPDERQKLTEEAINAQIEAESFGKTAKYLQSGTFQGMAVGTGIGVVPGLTLGTLTGTLVGGTVSMVTGGVGCAIGAAAGAIHGPFWNMGKLAGKGIRKITGDLGWKATDEQKATLEKMLGQVNEQEPPSEADLTSMAEWEAPKESDGQTQTWWEYGASYMPSLSSGQESKSKGNNEVAKSGAKVEQNKEQAPPKRSIETDQNKPQPSTRARTKDNGLHQGSNPPNSASAQSRSRDGEQVDAPRSEQQESTIRSPQASSSTDSRKKPRKLRQQQPATKQHQTSPPQARKTPRKLEVRKK